MYKNKNKHKKLFSFLIVSLCLMHTHISLGNTYKEPLMTRIEQGTYNACVNLQSKLKALQKKLAPYGPYAYKATMLALPPVAYYAYCVATEAYLDYHNITDYSLGYFDHTRNEFVFYGPYSHQERTNHILSNKKIALPVIGLLAAYCWPQVFAKKQPKTPKRT